MSNVVGSAEVVVRGNIKPLEQSLTQAKAKTQEASRAMDRSFETTSNRSSRLTDAVNRTEKAVEQLAQAAAKMADAADRMGNATARAARQTDQLDGSAKRAAAAGTLLGTAMTRAGLAMAAGLVAAAIGAAKAINEVEEAQRRLANVVGATGNTTGRSLQDMSEQARQLSVYSGQSETAIKSAMTAVAQFGDIAGQTFTDVIRLATDLSATLGTDLTKSATDVAKALEEPAKAAEIFAGINFSESTARNAQALKDMGQTAQSTAMILGELSRRVGGRGATDGESLSGALDQAWNSFQRWAATTGAYDWSKSFNLSVLNGITGFFGDLATEVDGVDSDKLTDILDQLARLPKGSAGTSGYAGRKYAGLRDEFNNLSAPRAAARATSTDASLNSLGTRLSDSFGNADAKIEDTMDGASKAVDRFTEASKRATAAAERLAESLATSKAEAAQIQDLGQKYLDGKLSLEQYNEAMQVANTLRQNGVTAGSAAGKQLAADIQATNTMTLAIKEKTAADREAAQVAERIKEARAELIADTQAETAQLEAETRALSMTSQQAEVYLKTQDLIARAKQSGVEVTDELIQSINSEAQAYGAAKTKLDQMTEAQHAAKEAAEEAYQAQKAQFDYLNQTVSGGLIDVLTGKASAKDAIKDIGKQLNQSVLEAAIGGYGPMADLFGGQKSGGLFGDIFGIPTKNGALPVWVENSSTPSSGGGSGGGLFGKLLGLGTKLLGGGGVSFGDFGSVDLSGLPVNNDFSSTIGNDLASYHTGLFPGAPMPATRSVPFASTVAAPKFHTGLQSDEFLGVLQKGEEVLPRHMAGKRGNNVTININGVTDFDSFKRNQSQVMASVGQASAMAVGRNK